MGPPTKSLSYATVPARFLLASIFVMSGWSKIGSFGQTAGYMASKGLPFAEMLLIPTILIELGGGLMILLGWRARLGALAIFLFLIPVTLVFHAFWSADPAQMQNQLNHFMKNVAIMGGMLYVVVHGSGPWSLRPD